MRAVRKRLFDNFKEQIIYDWKKESLDDCRKSKFGYSLLTKSMC